MPWRSSRHKRQHKAAIELLLTAGVVLVVGSIAIWFMSAGYTANRGTVYLPSLPSVVLTEPSATTTLGPRPAAAAEPSVTTSSNAASLSPADATPVTPPDAP